MSQHDYTIANQGFPATRADINNALSAIATNNSGTSAPSTQYAGQFWIDTTSSTWTLYIHDGADDIQFATIDTSANTVNFIDSELGDNSVTTAKIADGNVTSAKLSYPLTTFSSTGIDDNATSTAITIDSSENVGIGTSSIQGKLHVFSASSGVTPSTSADELFLENSGTAGLTIGSGTSDSGTIYFGDSGDNNAGRFEYAHSDDSMRIFTSGSERMRINSSGQTLIGTTVAPANANTKLMVHVPISSSSSRAIEISHNTTGANKPGAGLGLIIDNGGESTNAATLTFQTASGGSLSERMRITTGGLIGIGTTSPSEKLEVNGTVKATQFVGGGLNPYRNIIINGDMSIAQRGTSATGLGDGDFGYFTVDRWKFIEGGAPTYEFTMSQDTDVPTGQGFATSLKMDCTTAQGSLAAADQLRISHLIEGQNLQYLKKGTSNAESVTLSFWVKSNKTGTYIVELYDTDNTRQISKSYTINSASTWEKKTITFAGDTTGAFDNDNILSLYVQFWLGAGTNYTSGTLSTSWSSPVNTNRVVGQVNLADNTANEWFITGVQLEAGTSSSDFEFLPYDVNLRRCYRYCYRINGNAIDDTMIGAVGYAATTSRIDNTIQFLVPMRAVPSVSEAVIETTPGNTASSLGSLFDDNGTKDITTLGFQLNADSGTPFTVNNIYFPRCDANASAFIEFDAEL